MLTSKTKALAMAGACSDKKALDIVTIDMKKMSSVCNYFLIASGTSTTHVRAIADNIVKKLKEKNEKLWHVEGQSEAHWILLDYGDVVGHIFLEETRRYYDLERLWGVKKIKKARRKRVKRKRV